MAKNTEKNLAQEAAAAEATAANGNNKPAEQDLLAMIAALKAEVEGLKKNSASATTVREEYAEERIGELSGDNAEKVMFTVPFNEMDPKDKVLDIGINGHHVMMRRGETVEVPRFVVMAYMDAMKQKNRSVKYQETFEKMVNLSAE